MLEWIRSKPVVQAAVAVAAGLGGLFAVVAGVEAVWGLFSSDPLIPWFGERVRRWSDKIVRFFALLGVVAFAFAVVTLLVLILKELRKVPPKVPDGAHVFDVTLHAGSDLIVQLESDFASTAQLVTFSARQGRNVIARNKEGEVDAKNKRFRLPLTSEETRWLHDGYLLVQMFIVTGDGQWTAADTVVVPTRAPLVATRTDKRWFKRLRQ